eukprot:SAG25_NODE_728_length_5697_cov_2.400322_4_plen_305_part_00
MAHLLLCVLAFFTGQTLADRWVKVSPSTPASAWLLVTDNSTTAPAWCYYSDKGCTAGSVPCHAPFDTATMNGGKDCCESGTPDEAITELYGLDENGRAPATASWWCEKNACWPTYFKEPEASLWTHGILSFLGFGILIPVAGILKGGAGIILDIGIICGAIGFGFAFIYGDGHDCKPNPHNPCDGHMDCPHDYFGVLVMVFWLGWRGYLFSALQPNEMSEEEAKEAQFIQLQDIRKPLKIVMGMFCALSSILCFMGVTRGHPRGYTADYMWGLGVCVMIAPLCLLGLVFFKCCKKSEEEDMGSD